MSITLTSSTTFLLKLKFMHNPILHSVMTPSMVRKEGKDPQLTGESAFPSVM
jgi:hypothetical protein